MTGFLTALILEEILSVEISTRVFRDNPVRISEEIQTGFWKNILSRFLTISCPDFGRDSVWISEEIWSFGGNPGRISEEIVSGFLPEILCGFQMESCHKSPETILSKFQNSQEISDEILSSF